MISSYKASTPLPLNSAIIRDPLVVPPDTRIIEAIAKMNHAQSHSHTTESSEDEPGDGFQTSRSSCVLVVEDNHLVGILTEPDVVQLIAQQHELDSLVAHQVMIPPAITVHESALTDCVTTINLLQLHRLHHLPVLDDLNCLAGLITRETLFQILHSHYASRQDLVENISDENNPHVHQLFDATPKISVQGYNRRRQLIYWNKASEKLYGYTKEEAIGQQLEDLIIPPQIRQPVIDEVQAWLDGGPPTPASELRLMNKDGGPVNVFSSHFMLTNLDGEPEMYCVDIDLSERKQAEMALEKSKERWQLALEKSDDLLSNVLPKQIADQLKEKKKTVASYYEDVTILFADIVGFASLSVELMPVEMYALLDDIFSAFDDLTEKHDLEKIRTIGDNYMVAAGVPAQRQDHVEAIADMALGILDEIEKFNARNQTNINMRIGINSGSVTAGVMGTKKFTYDIWGDAVNIASRMESCGVPGKIQVTQIVYEQLKSEYLLQHRGRIEIKGKGLMDTYFLTGKL